MELTEKERLMLVRKKGIICGLTLRILDMAHDSKNTRAIVVTKNKAKKSLSRKEKKGVCQEEGNTQAM